jgi:hypothetical protein
MDTAIILIAPPAVLMAAMFAVRSGKLPLSLAVCLGVCSLVVCGIALRAGVIRSCAINESECIGATATAYLFTAVWILAFLAFAVGVGTWRNPSR